MGICYLLFHMYPEGLALGTVLETEIINKYPKVALKLFFFFAPIISLFLYFQPSSNSFSLLSLLFCGFVFLLPRFPVIPSPSSSFGSVSRLYPDFRLTLQVKLICFNGLTSHSNLVVGEGVKCSFYKAHMPYSHTYPWAQPAFLAKQIFSLLRSAYCFRGVYDLLSDIFSYCITWKRVKNFPFSALWSKSSTFKTIIL